jgi:glycosyltransferase involved in cell wall biosynthesis
VLTAAVALVRLGASCLTPIAASQKELAQRHVASLAAQEAIFERWLPALASDTWSSRHLDRSSCEPKLELRCIPAWHSRPWPAPRIVGFPVSNAQGLIRLTQPLAALQRAGKALACVYRPLADSPGIPTVHDLARHRPDAVIAHQLLGEASLMTTGQWRRHLRDTFLVYSIDDLLTDMPQKSSLRQHIPADARSYLARTVPQFDRLVVSTAYLAEVYGKFAADTRIVPNRLERDVWLPLRSQRRTSARPRIGWAGGTAHAGDLQLIADVVAATANQVDWIFMGMCPDNIRPFVREFHPFGNYDEYPARLAALNLDLAVAPLEEIPFNRGKSNLRLLEYGVLGIPVICTDIDPYRDSPACRPANNPRAWLDAVRERIHDLDATAREGDAMRQWVLDHYILEDHLDSWLDAHLRR